MLMSRVSLPIKRKKPFLKASTKKHKYIPIKMPDTWKIKHIERSKASINKKISWKKIKIIYIIINKGPIYIFPYDPKIIRSHYVKWITSHVIFIYIRFHFLCYLNNPLFLLFYTQNFLFQLTKNPIHPTTYFRHVCQVDAIIFSLNAT